MIEIGKKAPNFSLKDKSENMLSLEDFKGKKIVIYFYPKDDTPGCTKESIGFSETMPEFESKNTVIIGVSKDSPKSHANFCTKYDLKVILLSDPDTSMINMYGAWQEKSMYGKKYMGIQRSTVLIDEKGLVQKHWPKVSVTGHVEDVLASV